MTEHELDSRPVVRCRGAADFLAALPHLTGFTATDSMFVISFVGARSGSAVRIDLPESEDPGETLSLLDFVSDLALDLASQQGSAVAVAIVITSSASFSADDGPPWHRLARRVERRMRRDGIEVRELCIVAADGWVSLFEPGAPRTGRALSEIAESPVARGALRHAAPPVDLSRLGEIPDASLARAAAVARSLEQHAPLHFPDSERVPPQSSESGNISDEYLAWIAEAGAMARELRGSAPITADASALLIRNAAHSDRWLIIALGLLTRPEFPAELAAELPVGKFSRIPIDFPADQAFPAGQSTASPPRSQLGWSMYRILNSVCPEFAEQGRLRGVCDRLIETIAATPEPLRPGLLCLSAWIWWLYGNQTVARRHVHEALAIDESHELARMVHRLTSKPLYHRLTSGSAPRRDAAPQTRSRRAAPR